MVSQSIGANRRLSNIIVAGVVFTILSVLTGALWLLFSYKHVVDMRAEYARLKDSVAMLRSTNPVVPEPVSEQLTANAVPAAASNTDVKNAAKTEQSIANKPTPEKQEEKAAIPIIETPKPEKAKMIARNNISLTYYTRRADNPNLENTLQMLGFKFEAKPLDKNTGVQKSNCIWFGAGVPVAEVKRVAYAMIQSGNTVKGIKRFPLSHKNPSYKYNVIEVGMELKYENYYARPLSIVEVERAKDFK